VDQREGPNLSDRLKTESSNLCAAPMSIDTGHANCRKVHTSWHKASRNVWLNFGMGEIAYRVAERFNSGRYKCLGLQVKSSDPKYSGGGGNSYNPVC
jgi:hypothetical protein